jgi:tetratricopeptide (TPR) repeat protein
MTDDSSHPSALDRGVLDTLYLLSQRYHSHGMYEPAADLLAFLLRQQPTSASLHLTLGKALHAMGRHDQAVTSYRKALALGLPTIGVHLYLGQCLIFLAQPEQAAVALRQFIALARAQPAAPELAQQLQQAGHLLHHVASRLRPPAVTTSADPKMLPHAPAA